MRKYLLAYVINQSIELFIHGNARIDDANLKIPLVAKAAAASTPSGGGEVVNDFLFACLTGRFFIFSICYFEPLLDDRERETGAFAGGSHDHSAQVSARAGEVREGEQGVEEAAALAKGKAARWHQSAKTQGNY